MIDICPAYIIVDEKGEKIEPSSIYAVIKQVNEKPVMEFLSCDLKNVLLSNIQIDNLGFLSKEHQKKFGEMISRLRAYMSNSMFDPVI